MDPPILDSYLNGNRNKGVYNSFNLGVYNYTYQNPVKYVDPNGKTPITGAIMGAAIEYVAQVGLNRYAGKSWSDAVTHINLWDLGIATGMGAITSGGSAITKIANNKIVKNSFKKVIKFGLETMIETVENAAKDYANTGSVDIIKALTGGLLEAGLGGLLPTKYISRQIKKQDRIMSKAFKVMNKKKFVSKTRRANAATKFHKAFDKKSMLETAKVSIDVVNGAFAEGGANALTDKLYEKTEGTPIQLPSVIIIGNKK